MGIKRKTVIEKTSSDRKGNKNLLNLLKSYGLGEIDPTKEHKVLGTY